MSEEEKDLTELEKAKAMLVQEKQERIKRCQDRLEAVLKEERCSFQIQVALQGLTLVPHLALVAMD